MEVFVANEQPVADAEFAAMQTLFAALEPLDDDARRRVVIYIVARLEIDAPSNATHRSSAEMRSNFEEDVEIEKEQEVAPKYSSFAELHDAAGPKTNADKALVAGYWLQVCQGGETFDGHSANRELKQLGHGLANITAAIDALKRQKPALALQLRKSGKSQQARKEYKISVAGIKAVETMING
jgi:hypothetical protein